MTWQKTISHLTHVNDKGIAFQLNIKLTCLHLKQQRVRKEQTVLWMGLGLIKRWGHLFAPPHRPYSIQVSLRKIAREDCNAHARCI